MRHGRFDREESQVRWTRRDIIDLFIDGVIIGLLIGYLVWG